LVDNLAQRCYNYYILKQQEQTMGYKVLGNYEDVMQGYGPRKGLDGPMNFNGRVVYYDVREGRYWDPRTDFYLSHSEALEMYELRT
jgi:hypothetical protein